MKEKKGETVTLSHEIKALQMSEISLLINDYNDIFSSFDPRPYSQRAMSGDFLSEAHKASRDKDDKITLKILMSKHKRDVHTEIIIKERLKRHFEKHFYILKKEKTDMIKEGIIFVMIGMILMLIATFILFKYAKKDFLLNFIIIILEPGGWFLFWEGLNQIIFESRKTRAKLEFYRKMSRCEITFLSY